jgi:hypothetical protein
MDDSKAIIFVEESIKTINLLLSEPVELGIPQISCGQPSLWEFTGLIRVSVGLEGFVCLSFTQEGLDLLAHTSSTVPAEDSVTSAERERLLQEMISHIATSAGKKMGGQVKVSVPMTRESSQKIEAKLPFMRFCLPIGIGHHSALILLAFKQDIYGDHL